jgi:hypothetical protein
MVLSGNVGLRFNLIETTGNTTTGTYTQTHSITTTVGDMTIGTTDVAVSLYGVVGANTYELKLDNIVNYTGAGTGIDVQVIRNQKVAFNNIKMLSIYNQATSKNLIITPGTNSTFLAASEQVTLKPLQGMAFAYGNQETVGVSSSCIYIKGSAASTPHSIYVFGN